MSASAAARSNLERDATIRTVSGVIAAALTAATLAVVVASFPALDPNPLVAREAVAREIAQIRTGFADVFERARLRYLPTAEAEPEKLAQLVGDPDSVTLHRQVSLGVARHRKAALERVLERLTGILDTLTWRRGVARRHGAALDGTEPDEDVADAYRVQYAYELWEKLDLRPALRADPAFSDTVANDIVRLRPEFESLTRPVQPNENDLSKFLFRRGGVAFAATFVLLSVVWFYTVTWLIACVRDLASHVRARSSTTAVPAPPAIASLAH